MGPWLFLNECIFYSNIVLSLKFQNIKEICLFLPRMTIAVKLTAFFLQRVSCFTVCYIFPSLSPALFLCYFWCYVSLKFSPSFTQNPREAKKLTGRWMTDMEAWTLFLGLDEGEPDGAGLDRDVSWCLEGCSFNSHSSLFPFWVLSCLSTFYINLHLYLLLIILIIYK